MKSGGAVSNVTGYVIVYFDLISMVKVNSHHIVMVSNLL